MLAKDKEEVERYQRLLEDWKWSGKSNKQETEPAPTVTRKAVLPTLPNQTSSPSAPPRGRYQEGAILCLNGRTLAIYRQAVPEKEYHLVLVLFPNQQVKTQGIALDGYQVEELGMLPPEVIQRIQREMRWSRDMVVFHCYSLDDVNRIPEQLSPPGSVVESSNTPAPSSPASAQPEAEVRVAEPPKPGGITRRGQRIQVRFGDRCWDAVYWGKDDQGQVVAHKTHREWSLMHLDLDRFGTDLLIDPEADMELVAEIEESLGRG